METYDKDTITSSSKKKRESIGKHLSGRVMAGLIVIAVGVILLADELGAIFPHWLISWPMLLIVIGLLLGFRHSFRGPAWIIMTVIGSIFLIDRIYPWADFEDLAIPLVIISVGVVILLRSLKKNPSERFGKRWEENYGTHTEQASDDYLDSTTLFGGVKKNIISKTFRGGDISTFFGGTELNLTQADVTGRIELDITQIFGGTKLIVPPHWKVQSEDLVCIFGGVDDKRPATNDAVESTKVLVLKGTCIFGGIDIKSF